MIKLENKPGMIFLTPYFKSIFSSTKMCLNQALAAQSESLSVYDEKQNIL